MSEVTITLTDETKRTELLELVSRLPYVGDVKIADGQHNTVLTADIPAVPQGEKVPADDHQINRVLEGEDPLDREVVFFEEKHAQLVEEFLGQYIAIYQGQVIAHHDELDALMTSVQGSHPQVPVLFRQVQATLPPTITIRSPRLESTDADSTTV